MTTRTTHWMIAAVLLSVMALAPSARAGDIFRTNGGGDWNDTSTWEMKDGVDHWSPAERVPGCDDTAMILEADIVTIDGVYSAPTQYITTLQIQQWARVELYDAELYTCGSDASITIASANGLWLASHSGGWSMLRITTDTLIDGAGSVRFVFPDDRIRIGPESGSSTVTLTSECTIDGGGHIEAGSYGHAVFNNYGLVRADASAQTLWVDKASLYALYDSGSNDCSDPRWQCNSGCMLRFTDNCTGLVGNFVVAGYLAGLQLIETSGQYTLVGGGDLGPLNATGGECE